MTFKETLAFLEQLGEFRMRLDLSSTQEILQDLGRPDQNLSSVIVSGTNGKGSVCCFLTSIAKAAHMKVGTFTSPHLYSPTERICLNETPISEEAFAFHATQLLEQIPSSSIPSLTYFEFLTLLALRFFSQEKVSFAIWEVGLGGRLDSTNALERIGTIITSIDFDHVSILGNTLSSIAQEKAGIMRQKVPVVVAHQHPEALKKLEETAQSLKAVLVEEGKDYWVHGGDEGFSFTSPLLQLGPIPLGLLGKHQIHNAGASVALCLEIQKKSFSFSSQNIEMGLRSARLPGRLEKWVQPSKPSVWLDVAHNPAAIQASLNFFQEFLGTLLSIVVGMQTTKDWKTSIELLAPHAKRLILCKPNTPKAWDFHEVLSSIRSSLDIETIEDPALALRKAQKQSEPILCLGSFYIMSELQKELFKQGYQSTINLEK